MTVLKACLQERCTTWETPEHPKVGDIYRLNDRSQETHVSLPFSIVVTHTHYSLMNVSFVQFCEFGKPQKGYELCLCAFIRAYEISTGGL